MNLTDKIRQIAGQAISALYQADTEAAAITVSETKPEFEGDYTIVLFAFTKTLRQSPEALGKAIGEYLLEQHPAFISAHNTIKGFLNLTIADGWWTGFLNTEFNNAAFGRLPANGKKVMVEYSSPNTNKPLHLGHLRNNFLGWSCAAIAQANGYEVYKSCIVNDRGVHICKSMLAWQKFANGATPASTGIKGDHFVGDYYVKFEGLLRQETAPLLERVMAGDTGMAVGEDRDKLDKLLKAMAENENRPDKLAELKDALKELVRNYTPAMLEVKAMLQRWEAGDPATRDLWKMMNGWVYEGFDLTYKRIGTDFDKIYYESDTYLMGRDLVARGLGEGVFFKKEDGSVWIDLTADGLDEKLVLRRDGTSVYITQDMGLVEQKHADFGCDKSMYVIADEQNYHMKVLKLISEKLKLPNAEGIQHLTYGMVELPEGRMKSREGTVVDADDLCDEMVATAAAATEELGKVKDFSEEELKMLHETIALGALKFYLLRVEPRKKMVFNPEESIDLHGFTGPFIQYTHARIRSILRKEAAAGNRPGQHQFPDEALLPREKQLIAALEQYPLQVALAGAECNPSIIANYIYHLAKTYNSFYQEHSVSNAETAAKKELRLRLCQFSATVISNGMGLLGIRVPERM